MFRAVESATFIPQVCLISGMFTELNYIDNITFTEYTFTCGLVVSSFLFIGAGFATNAISLISIQAVNGIGMSTSHSPTNTYW